MNGPVLRLRRLDSNAFATYGQLFDAEESLIAVTLEKPWVDTNHDGLSDRNVSCIPPGVYPAHRRRSPKRGYDVFELEGVPGRSNIEIHIGNLPKDSEGCILVGSNFGEVAGLHGITGSAVAFARFMSRFTGVDRLTLEVIAPPAVSPPQPSGG